MDTVCLTGGNLLFIIGHCVCSPGGMWEIAVRCTEFCCEYKTTLRNKVLFLTIENSLHSTSLEYDSVVEESTGNMK